MSRTLHSEMTHDWKAIADKLTAVCGAIHDLETEMLLNLGEASDAREALAVTDVCNRLTAASEALRGLPYLCTPQSEWTGGESWVVRVPHIINDAKL